MAQTRCSGPVECLGLCIKSILLRVVTSVRYPLIYFTVKCFLILSFPRHMKLQAAARKYDSDVDKISVDFKGICPFHPVRLLPADPRLLDVLTPTTVIMGAVIVIAFISAPTLLFLIQDMFHIVPKRIVRMLKMSDKTLSTSTLAYQAMGFALSTILLIVPLGFLTVSVFTKDARAVITQNGLDCPATLPPCTPIIYRDTQYSMFCVGSTMAKVMNLNSFSLFSPNQCRATLGGGIPQYRCDSNYVRSVVQTAQTYPQHACDIKWSLFSDGGNSRRRLPEGRVKRNAPGYAMTVSEETAAFFSD